MDEGKVNEYQVSQYQKQLEQHGYSAGEARRISTACHEQYSEVTRVRHEQERHIQFVRAQGAAADHFVKKYGLDPSDLDRLRQYDNPQSMEEAAKDIRSCREDKI